MSWQIPTQVELDIIAGKAVYQTFQTGNGGQSILQVPTNSYAVIFGYDFSPAGGGAIIAGSSLVPATNNGLGMPIAIAALETQQISFYTGSEFFPFIHHVNIDVAILPEIVDASNPLAETITRIKPVFSIDNTPIARQIYITSNNDVTITVGLVDISTRASSNAIPITNRTPQGLTYGGSPQIMNTQTNYGPAGTPQQFMQPSPKDFADFAFGALPGNADNQAFATPDLVNGLTDPTTFINSNYGAAILGKAAPHYFLCLHYALYSQTIPEQRG
jgi:hypothetical protein